MKWVLVALMVAAFSGAGVAFASSLTVDSDDVTVFKNTLQATTTTTSLTLTSIAEGEDGDASATLGSTAVVAPSGSVTYTVYDDDLCTSLYATAGTVTVTAGVVPDSPPVNFPTAGSYYWRAAYSGDGYNQPSFHCLSTPLVVNPPPGP
ncbi:MAG: hypothetical protein R3B59_04705 [Dehalococcoidia bacterium]